MYKRCLYVKRKILECLQQKNDEYFTLYDDIANEVSQYRSQLKGMRILCPCDWDEAFEEEIVYDNGDYVPSNDLLSKGGNIKDINISATLAKFEKDITTIKCNFVKFLIAHAEDYGIKSISVSGYNPYTGEGIKFQDINYSKYDLVITNPPFSLFVEFINVMFNNKMKFLVIGPLTALSYKEVFLHIKSNEMWLGYAKQLSGFMLADGTTILSKNPEGSVPRACKWYTNLDVKYRHDKLILTEKYFPDKYPNYFNYNGIDISKTVAIPYDFEGHMGVPISFLSKYNPEQFEIIGKGVQIEKTVRFKGDKATLWIEKDGKPFKAPFERIIIRNKEVYHDED